MVYIYQYRRAIQSRSIAIQTPTRDDTLRPYTVIPRAANIFLIRFVDGQIKTNIFGSFQK